MRRSALIFSVAFHIAMLLFSIFGMPFVSTRDFIIPAAPIAIDFVEVGLITQTDKLPSGGAPGVKKDDETPPPLPNQSPKAETNKGDDADTPLPTPKKDSLKEEKNKDKEKDSDLIDEAALATKNDKKNKDDKAKAEKEKQKAAAATSAKDKQFKSVLKNLMEDEDTNSGGGAAQGTGSGNGGINAPLGEKMTISQQDAVRAQLEKCWNVPSGAKDVEDMVVEVVMEILPDRTVKSAKIVDMGRYNRDTFYRAVADSALRAVRSPSCSPLLLPPDMYEMWKKTTVRFNPRDMF